MSKRAIAAAAGASILFVATSFLIYHYWRGPETNPVLELLSHVPVDASTVVYVDVAALRQSPFLAELYRWAPQPTAESDYAQFVQATGFNYERDLQRVGVAISQRGQANALFAIADGAFDRKKLSAYALQAGTRTSRDGRELFSLPVNPAGHSMSFTFLRNDRIALTNSGSTSLAPQAQPASDAQAWAEQFRRLAGSPVFAVIRQDAAIAAALDQRTPSSFQSPQLSSLLAQLQWITVAGKPEANRLRVVLEGETAPQSNTRQMADVLNGLLVLAQAGLSDPRLREHLPPQVRQAYLEVLKSADVSRLDRGDSKSVRLIFDITPEFLEAVRASTTSKDENNKIRN